MKQGTKPPVFAYLFIEKENEEQNRSSHISMGAATQQSSASEDPGVVCRENTKI